MAITQLQKMLADVSAIITESHVVYTSGRHGSVYVNKDALFMHPQVTTMLARSMARTFNADKIDVVAGKVTGGIILSQWVAWHLSAARTEGEVLAIFAEEEGPEQHVVFRRGYGDVVPGRRVVVVDDVMTTGGSAREVIEAVRALGGTVAGLSVLINRGNVQPEDVGTVPIFALLDLDFESWDQPDCPLCQAGVPINTTVGKGRAFLERQAAQPSDADAKGDNS